MWAAAIWVWATAMSLAIGWPATALAGPDTGGRDSTAAHSTAAATVVGPAKSAVTAAGGDCRASGDLRASVDPTLKVLRRMSKRRLSDASIFRARDSFDTTSFDTTSFDTTSFDTTSFDTTSFDTTGATVVIRFRSRPTKERTAKLGEGGVRFSRDADGLIRHLGLIYWARARWSAVDRLANQPDIADISAAWHPGMSRPLEVTGEVIGAPSSRRRPDFEADGADTSIALIDTGIDVLHPFFFHADAGLYRWLDVNGDGAFGPGVDAVDLDGDGRASRNEVLRVVDATDVLDFRDRQLDNVDGVVQPRRDWVYADSNGDRRRNVGVDAGFSESTPAYGEPIFVVDDANRDGQLQPAERLVRLGSSKVVSYWTPQRRFERGVDLIESATGGAVGGLHGTGTAGILVGGQPRYHRRAGIAPAAKLRVYGLGRQLVDDLSVPLDALDDAVDQGADVVLHEWTNAFTMPLDGSTSFEQAMSAARDAGVIQVNPMGNLNRSEKHVQRRAAPGDTMRLAFHVGDGFEQSGDTRPYLSVFGSLQWRGEHVLDVALVTPDGRRFEASAADVSQQLGDVQLDMTRQRTTRDTTVVRFYVESADDDVALPAGVWKLELGGFTERDTVYGRITDAYSNWGRGVGWEAPTPDVSTLAFPATADAAVGVGAFAGRRPTPIAGGADVGQLRTFSGRGPRIDGRQAVDLAAPDDPFVPLGGTPAILQAGWGRSWFMRFGGTSGAGPHVAGSAALVRQRHPRWRPEEVEQRLFDTTRRQGLAPAPEALPDPGWGWGKLDVYRALFDAEPVDNARPEARLRVTRVDGMLVLDGSDSRDPDGDRLQFRFDLDYDGHWESSWRASPIYRQPTSAVEAGQAIRFAVRDIHGARAGQARLLDVPADLAGDVGAGDVGPADVGAGDAADMPTCSSGGPPRRSVGRSSAGWAAACLLGMAIWLRRAADGRNE